MGHYPHPSVPNDTACERNCVLLGQLYPPVWLYFSAGLTFPGVQTGLILPDRVQRELKALKYPTPTSIYLASQTGIKMECKNSASTTNSKSRLKNISRRCHLSTIHERWPAFCTAPGVYPPPMPATPPTTQSTPENSACKKMCACTFVRENALASKTRRGLHRRDPPHKADQEVNRYDLTISGLRL